jgi:hypothetical protein
MFSFCEKELPLVKCRTRSFVPNNRRDSGLAAKSSFTRMEDIGDVIGFHEKRFSPSSESFEGNRSNTSPIDDFWNRRISVSPFKRIDIYSDYYEIHIHIF